jgi:hypothetical protein
MPTRSQQGDMAETDFLARATKQGFRVCYPYGKDCRYDLILDNGLIRFLVQVKSTAYCSRKGVYHARCGRGFGHGYQRTVPYVDSEIDFIVILVVPEQAWYILPIEALQGRTFLSLHSRDHEKKGPWEPFRENWDLFRQHQTPDVTRLRQKIGGPPRL